MNVIIEGVVAKAGWVRGCNGAADAALLRFTVRDAEERLWECEVADSGVTRLVFNSMRARVGLRVVGQLLKRVGGCSEFVDVAGVELGLEPWEKPVTVRVQSEDSDGEEVRR